jgi:hypothetical protein
MGRKQKWSEDCNNIDMLFYPANANSIVFVHGLRGGRESTWTKDGVVWPKELLSKDIPKSRILSFGYNSEIVHSDTAEVTQGSLADDARQLCSLLDDARSQTSTVRCSAVFYQDFELSLAVLTMRTVPSGRSSYHRDWPQPRWPRSRTSGVWWQ